MRCLRYVEKKHREKIIADPTFRGPISTLHYFIHIINRLLTYEADTYNIMTNAIYVANPPEHMAELFKEVIQTDFRNCFKAVIFAILDTQSPQDHNPEGNVAPFATVFNTEPIDIDDFIQLNEL